MLTPTTYTSRSSSRLACVLGALAVASTLLSGCAGMATTATDMPVQANASISGTVYGGSNAIQGATVKLYAIGTSGYGSAGTLLATSAATTSAGAFSFSQVASGATGPTGSSYVCPTSNTQLYVLSTGGFTVGVGTTSNSAIGFLSAIGTCGTASGSKVNLNEAVTTANVFALAQYISPGATAGKENIGISSSALAATAYANAVSGLANLVYNGYTSGPQTYSGSNASVSGVTVTATAETTKIATIADALAACTNTTASTSAACTDLFNSVTLPYAASVTSQPSATFSTPADIIQAAYYLAVNPANNGAFTSCTTTPTATTRTGCLFGLLTGTAAPFQPALAAAPVDWTVGVTYTASGTCTGGGVFITGAYHAAIDGSGNIWFMNGGSSTVSNISEMSPKGVPLQCLGANAAGRGLTIDVAGNVWGSFNGNTTGGGIVEIPAGTSTVTTWPVTSGQQTYEMTSDGFGNVFYNVNASGGTIWEFVNAASTATPFSPVQVAGPLSGTGTVTQGYIQIDSLGRIWDATSTVQDLFDITPKTQAAITAYQVSGGSVTFTATNSFTTGQVVQVNGLTTTEGLVLDNQSYTVTAATASNFTAATSASTIGLTTDAGTGTLAGSYTVNTLAGPTASAYGIAIDSNNYIYQGTTCCGSAAPYREPVKWTPSSTPSSSTFSTSATTNFAGTNGTRSVVVDGASNVFVGNEYPNSSGASATTGTYSIAEYTTSGSGTTATFIALSPTGSIPTTCSTSAGCATGGGFFDNDFDEPFDMQVDPSGNLWVINSGTAASTVNGTSITELVGVAVPVVTPLSVAVKNGQLGTKP